MRALESGESILVAAPTGAGKTIIAEYAVARARAQNRRALYTSPIKALSGQKYRDWQARFGQDAVGLLTGDTSQRPEAPILVMTTEVARNMVLQDPSSLRDVGCIIFDEVHFLADPERGTAWEEALLYAPAEMPLVCLSATVPNADEIATWMRRVHGPTTLITHEQRPVPLRHLYYAGGTLHPLVDTDGTPAPSIPAVGGESRRPRPPGIPLTAQPQEAPSVDAMVQALAQAEMLPAIVFLFSRRECERRAAECRRIGPRDRARSQARRARIRAYLASLPADDRSLDHVVRLTRLIENGIAFHHAGLLPVLKHLVESLLADGLLDVVFATETLALGINVPARTVVVGEPAKFDGRARRALTTNEYTQLTGRAGRRGLDVGGNAVSVYSSWVSAGEVQALAGGGLQPIRSAFRPLYNSVVSLYQPNRDGADRLPRLLADSLRRYQLDAALRDAKRQVEALRRELGQLTFDCPVPGVDDPLLANTSSSASSRPGCAAPPMALPRTSSPYAERRLIRPATKPTS